MKKLLVSGLALAAVMGNVGTVQAVSLNVTLPTLTRMTGTTLYDGSPLVNNILGPGITIVGTPVYKGKTTSTSDPRQAAGIFSNGLAAGIGLDQGIILSTGDVTNAPGPNGNPENVSGAFGTPGDNDLFKNFSDPTLTADASLLDFYFKSASANLFFDFVFASDEYNEYVHSNFNDVFAFFLDLNKNGFFEKEENIALVPGTSTPVSVNNVTYGLPTTAGDWPYASNPQYFNNNDPSDVNNEYNPTRGTLFDIEYDGFTDVFTARASGLTIGETYRIKLVIADVGDALKDSAVFIGAGTFSNMPTGGSAVPEPATFILLGTGLTAMGISGRRKKT